MTYYSQRKSILNGQPQTVNNRYGTRREMERQFHLYCANACDGQDFPFDVDSIEWGTLELGVIERKVYVKQSPEQEPEELEG
jgi:hypothetical protein